MKTFKTGIIIFIFLVVYFIQLFVDISLYYGVYNISVFSGIEIACAVGMIILINKEFVSAVKKKITGIIFGIIYVLCIAAFVIFLPKYTMSQATEKIQNENPSFSYVIVNENYPVIGLSQNDGLVHSLYVISANDNSDIKNIYFNPNNGNYQIQN